MAASRTSYTTCPLCEATCGLELTLGGGEVLGVRGDRDDVFSRGYTASTVDQMPKQVSAAMMFGTMLSVPIPDVDCTAHLMIVGANPLA